MEILGNIVEILSGKHVLLKLNREIQVDRVLTVYSAVPVAGLKEKYGLDGLHLPKGEIRVLSGQGNGLYLAETFRESHTRPRQPPFANLNLGNFGLLSGLIAEEVVEGPPSARLASPTVPVTLEVDRKVKVGDSVGVA